MDRILFSTPESLDRQAYVVATYLAEYEASADVMKAAAAVAVGQTTSSWKPVPGETAEMLERHVGRVVAIHEIPGYEFETPAHVETRRYIIEIAFPWVNFGFQTPMLLTTVFGNISSAGKIKLLDLFFPESFCRGFQGPKFGVEGVRKILGVQNRPLLLSMIKPCTGYTPAQGGEIFYQAALGGADIIKDDELIADPPFCPLVDRVSIYTKKAERVFEQTGEKTLYAVNVTDRADRVKENAKRAMEGGAKCIMLNYLTTGVSVLQSLAEDPDVEVPIIAHLDFAGALYESHYSGVSSHLILGKLARLAGADMVVYPSHYGKFPILKERYLRIAHHLANPFYHLKRTFPAPAGGVHPGIVPILFEELGSDLVVAAGGAVHGHPEGAAAGAKAHRQAIEAAMSGISLHDAAKEHEELRAALDALGR